MAKPEKANWSSFTKAELIRTIKSLDKRQTQLLNRVAKLETDLARADDDRIAKLEADLTRIRSEGLTPQFPWEMK